MIKRNKAIARRKDFIRYLGPNDARFRLSLICACYPVEMVPACLLVLNWVDTWRRMQHDCVLIYDKQTLQAKAGMDCSLSYESDDVLQAHLRLLSDMLFDRRFADIYTLDTQPACSYDPNILAVAKDERRANFYEPYLGYVNEKLSGYHHVNSYSDWFKVIFSYRFM